MEPDDVLTEFRGDPVKFGASTAMLSARGGYGCIDYPHDGTINLSLFAPATALLDNPALRK